MDVGWTSYLADIHVVGSTWDVGFTLGVGFTGFLAYLCNITEWTMEVASVGREMWDSFNYFACFC